MTITRFSTGAIRDNALATNVSFAASDMELIGTVRVGSGGVASVTFSNIPQEYKHLQIRGIGRGTAADWDIDTRARINGDTGTNYAWHYLRGNGSAASSASATTQAYLGSYSMPAASAASNIFGAHVIDILDYSNGSKNKTVRLLNGFDENTGSSNNVFFVSGLWMSTAAVTSFQIYTASSNIAQFSRWSLYGIRG